MSTKIYDGMQASQPIDAFRLADGIRSVLEPLFYSRLDGLMDMDPEDFASLQRALCHPSPVDFRSPLVFHDVPARIDELHASRFFPHHPLDIGYEVRLYPSGARPLVLVFGGLADVYVEALLESGLTEPFGYWDDTDGRPFGVTADQWEVRREVWERGAGDLTALRTAGLGFRHPSPADISTHIVEHRMSEEKA